MKNGSNVGEGQHVLGLDIGANSIGWALVARKDGKLAGVVRTGVRVFAAGVEGDIESGRDESRAAKRREARLRRRMLGRRRGRQDKLALLLQQAGLLPAGDLATPKARMQFFGDLDRSLFPEEVRRSDPHVLPYRLRGRALDEKLAPYELGRALYHLAQRRGFLSSRRFRGKPPEDEQDKDAAKPGSETQVKRSKDKEDEGKVKGAISELQKRIEQAGKRTLGEYFASLDPTEERIRRQWTGRKMFEEEFENIWAAQSEHHPDILTQPVKKQVHRAIFFQRASKVPRHLIGECDLERGRKRAPMALLAAQRFRLLQKVNDLQIKAPDGQTRALSAEERQGLADALETRGDLTWKEIRGVLRLGRTCHFNLEDERPKGLIGNRTACELAKVFGDRWASLSPEEKDRVVDDLRSIQVRSVKDEQARKRRGMKTWGLDEVAARGFCDVHLEDGYCSLSRRALEKVLPLMEQGVQYATARKKLYGEKPPKRAVDALPLLSNVVQVRNPAVQRALTEVRKVVNAIVREHGKPAVIRIELARDLKKPRQERREISRRNEQNRSAREKAAERICQEAGVTKPTRSDTEKLLLAEECGWVCPYTGKPINMDGLFGDSPQFDVEHIIPLQRCLDDSFMNKTLCQVEENRNRKRNRTPWEAYGSDPDRWDEIIQRVKRFQGGARKAKLERFQIKDLESIDDFASRQLNDTRYAARLAVEFLGCLYGAGADGVDSQNKQRRIQAARGQVTAFLRNEWKLNEILGGGEKRRDDHRQHAIDAAVVALTDSATVKMLSDAAARAWQEHRRRFAPIAPPWPGFLDEVRGSIDKMIVSHRVSRKVSGAMHDETIYSKPHKDPDGRECVHVRKPVDGLSTKDLDHIVDPAVRDCVTAKLKELGEEDPKKAFSDEKNHPPLKGRGGEQTPIHSVRIRRYEATVPIGEGARERRVMLGSNHHMEILETEDKKGQPRWEGVVVSTYEAMQRLRAKKPVVQSDHGPGKKFLFSLAGGEIIEIDENDGTRGLYVIRTVSKSRSGGKEYPAVEFVSITDARKKEEIKSKGAWGSALVEPLRKKNCRKMLITPLGEVRWAND